MLRRLRLLALVGMFAWASVWSLIAWAQAPTLPEMGRRVERLEVNIEQIKRDQTDEGRAYERRLTAIETETKGINQRLDQLNTLLWGLLGALGVGSAGAAGRAVYKNSSKRNTKDADQ